MIQQRELLRLLSENVRGDEPFVLLGTVFNTSAGSPQNFEPVDVVGRCGMRSTNDMRGRLTAAFRSPGGFPIHGVG